MVKKLVAGWSKNYSRHGRKISRGMVEKLVVMVETLDATLSENQPWHGQKLCRGVETLDMTLSKN